MDGCKVHVCMHDYNAFRCIDKNDQRLDISQTD